jgi:hypothetical protein
VVTVQRFGALGAVDTEYQQLRHLTSHAAANAPAELYKDGVPD